MHGVSESSIRDIEMVFERAQNVMQGKGDFLDTMRIIPLASTIHDDYNNYALPSDFKKPIDLYPQGDRTSLDKADRTGAETFDLERALTDKTVSIESSEGTKYIRVNWRGRAGQLLNDMDSVTGNGTWSGVGTASGIVANSIFKISGEASIEFDVSVDGDGIQNTDMEAVDMTDEDEVADVFVWMYFGDVSNLNSISAKWGNDLTTKYWTSVAQTSQADGTAFRSGWNLLKFPWSTATETGTVDPTAIDSFSLILTDVDAAITNIRVDNIVFSIGRPFDIKYYSKYIFRNSAGSWISRPTSDNDVIVLDNDAIQIFLYESLVVAAQQMQGKQIATDVNLAKDALKELYAQYEADYPSQAIKSAEKSYRLKGRRNG